MSEWGTRGGSRGRPRGETCACTRASHHRKTTVSSAYAFAPRIEHTENRHKETRFSTKRPAHTINDFSMIGATCGFAATRHTRTSSFRFGRFANSPDRHRRHCNVLGWHLETRMRVVLVGIRQRRILLHRILHPTRHSNDMLAETADPIRECSRR